MLKRIYRVVDREKQALAQELSQVRGLMPLLMKPRNNQKWSAEDRLALSGHLRGIRRMSSYVVILVLPGGFVMLPALAWWLDRRRGRRQHDQPGQS